MVRQIVLSYRCSGRQSCRQFRAFLGGWSSCDEIYKRVAQRFDRKTYDRILNPVAVSEIRGLVSSRGPVSLDKLFNKAALNVVWNFVSGTRYAYDDQRMHRLLGKEQYTLPRFVLYFLFLCKDILVYPELLKFIRVLTVSSKRILKSLVLK